MKNKGLISIVLILAIATLTAVSISVRAHNDPINYVKVYVWNPATASNVYPALANPAVTYAQVWIDSPALWDNTPSGIIGVTMSFRVDPSVVDLLSALQWPDTDYDGVSNGFLGDFLSRWGYNWEGYSTFFTAGTIDTPSGTITATAEIILGAGTLGVGAGGGPIPLWRYVVRTNAAVPDYTTAYSPLTIFDAYYTTVDGAKHRIDIVENGHYGTPPDQFYMSGPPATGFTPAMIVDPIGTIWHELYPNYCNNWELTSYIDNGDGYFSASDQIDMMNETGWTYWFHVDVVTVTIHWTFKEGLGGPLLEEYGSAEPPEIAELTIDNPIGTVWHQIYPEYSREFVITSFDDNGSPGFDPSDQFDFEYLDDPGTVYWAHLDSVTTDIFLSQKGEPEPPVPEFPLGLGLMMAVAPAIPIVYLWRTRKKVGKQ